MSKPDTFERYLDGYELSLLQIWITLRGELSNITKDALATIQGELQNTLDRFTLGKVTVEGGFPGARFVPASKPAFVGPRDWDDSAATAAAKPYTVAAPAYTQWSAGQPLVGVYVAQRDTDVQLTVCASHAICDGRTIEGIYRIVAHILDESIPVPADSPFPPFSKDSFYPGVPASERAEVPSSWKEVPTDRPILPPLPEGAAFQTVATYVRYAYPPIKKWCREHSLGVQSLLTASEARAHRTFNSMNATDPLWVAMPVDTRTSPLVSQELAKRELFNGSGMAFVRVNGHDSLVEEAADFQSNLKKALAASNEICRYPLFFNGLVNEKTGEFVPKGGCPTFCGTPLINASNVGSYRHVKNPRLCPLALTIPGLGFYTVSLYCYYDDNVLEAFVLHPDVMEPKLLDKILSGLDEAFVVTAGSFKI